MAQSPGGLAQQMLTPPTPLLCMPQMVPSLCQPPPGLPATSAPCAPQTVPPLHQLPLGGLATPYQQVVQPPKKPMGRGVTADAPTDKTASVGSVCAQDRRRPSTRGSGGSSQSVSHPRGVPGKASVQPPQQEGDLPSGSMPSVPPPPAPEGTQPQWGGQPRSALCDPTWLAANFHSSGRRKDLEHILRVYYKFSVASFREAEWVRVKEWFFVHFLQYKEEALALKEARPMEFMAYIQDLFYQATGLHFTGWIKWGSYYHRLVAQQGCLHECLHLMGAPLPRWPQVAPSESSQESQMKSDIQIPSSSMPSLRATAAPIAEVPVAEAPVAETPITEAPVDETPGAEAPAAPSSTPAPMETGRVGDGQSWADQMEAGKEETFQRSRPAKRTRLQSRRREPKPPLPFPLWDSEGRLASISQLYAYVAEQPIAEHNVAGSAIMHLHLEVLPQNARLLGNQVMCMIAEYHLTKSARGSSSLSPIIPQLCCLP